MAKSSKASRRMPAAAPSSPAASQKFMDRDLCKVDPKKEQFEPTEACPVRQHARMAGQG